MNNCKLLVRVIAGALVSVSLSVVVAKPEPVSSQVTAGVTTTNVKEVAESGEDPVVDAVTESNTKKAAGTVSDQSYVTTSNTKVVTNAPGHCNPVINGTNSCTSMSNVYEGGSYGSDNAASDSSGANKTNQNSTGVELLKDIQ